MKHARATLVVNSKERDILLRHSPDARVDVLENGVDLRAFTPKGPPSPNPTVVFCGVMNYAPNEAGAISGSRAKCGIAGAVDTARRAPDDRRAPCRPLPFSRSVRKQASR